MIIRKTLFILLILILKSSIGYSQNHGSIIQTIDSGKLNTFKQLVDSLDDINKILTNGYTILNYSIIRERIDFADYLIRKNVDIEKESRKQTPLMYSTRHNPDILKLLLSNGADINRKVDDRTALTIAIEEDRQDAINILEANGAIVELKGGLDGPYIFFDTLMKTTIMITLNERSELLVDTSKITPDELIVKMPDNNSIKVSLKTPKIEDKSIFNQPEKIFAISDIEGNYYDLVSSLKNNEIIDDKLNWKFGNGHLVLLGDFVDRGEYVTQVLWLIYKLEQEAQSMGGKVHYILGNHEVMNLQGYCHYADIKYKLLAYKSGMDIQDFYDNQTEFGAWLRTKNVIEKIGDIIFVHGGISDSLLQLNLSIPELNEIARNSFDIPYTELKNEAEIVLGAYGILWYRGFVSDDEYYNKISKKSLNKILRYYDAKNIVIGHNIVEDISTDYKGKIIRIDVDHYNNLSSGILIIGNKIYKAKETGEKELIFKKK